MAKVHLLDDNTINKIAAGEVVERPASVIKELVENAIDAKATRIEVEIMAGGTSFMRVTDNGIGMTKEDAELAIQRHATSKLSEVSDLLTINTLGFRGEALPSISSVSRFNLLTRRHDEALGIQLTMSGGKSLEIVDAGCSVGTTIKVEDLFFNTPARKKFLKTNNTEGNKISDFITKLAISNPQISFKFVNNNKQAISTPGNGNLYDTLQSLYGVTVADTLLPMDFLDQNGDITIGGYISKPSCIRSNRGWQTCIVNGRIISSKAITKAIDNAYHSLIPKSGFPLVVLLIKVPQKSIDVNVHPQKTEMKFEDESKIFKAVYKAVLDAIRPCGQTLSAVAAVPENLRPSYSNGFSGSNCIENVENAGKMQSGQLIDNFMSKPEAVRDPAVHPQYSMGTFDFGQIDNGVSHNLSDTDRLTSNNTERANAKTYTVVDVETGEIITQQDCNQASSIVENSYPAENAAVLTPKHINNNELNPSLDNGTAKFTGTNTMVAIGQVGKCYIIAQDAEGLYIVDQHAAHERILFDKFSSMTNTIPSQQLLVHTFMDFDKKESQLVENNLSLFKSLGFGLEASGPNQFRLTEIPIDIPDSEAEDIIREILINIQELHSVTAAELRHSCLATTACKAAIKSGFVLNMRQMQILLDQLNATAKPYTCPHGRPTIIKFTPQELDKMFKRTGF